MTNGSCLLCMSQCCIGACRHLDLGDCRGLDAPSLSSHLPQLTYLSHLVLDGILEASVRKAAVLGSNGVLCLLSCLASLFCLLVSQCLDVGKCWSDCTCIPSFLCYTVMLYCFLCCASCQVWLPDVTLQVGDGVLHALAAGCQQLHYLSINRCSTVTDGGLTALAGGLQGLEGLSCNMCDKVCVCVMSW